MAELTVRDGQPVPDGLPRGECVCTRLADGRIRVDHADPRVLISGELLDDIVRFGSRDVVNGDRFSLNARLDTAGCMPPPYRATYTGAVLKITGVNRTVIYRITAYVPAVNGYIAEWPD